MRKVFSFVFVLFLLLLLSAFSLAEGSVTSYNWSDVVGMVQEAFSEDSKYYLIEDVDAVIWLPSYFSSLDLTEEDINNDAVGSFVNASGDALVYLSYSDMDGLSFDSLYNYYSRNNYNVEIVRVNDIPAILLRDEGNNLLSLTYQTRDGKFFQVTFYPVLDQNYSLLYQLVISSIRPYSPLVEKSSEPVVSSNPVSGLISK